MIHLSLGATALHWNPLDSSDDELELASRFTATMVMLGTKNDDSTFWMDVPPKFVRHAIALVGFTNPPKQPPCFRDLLELATSFEAIVARTDRLDVSDARCDASASSPTNGPCSPITHAPACWPTSRT